MLLKRPSPFPFAVECLLCGGTFEAAKVGDATSDLRRCTRCCAVVDLAERQAPALGHEPTTLPVVDVPEGLSVTVRDGPAPPGGYRGWDPQGQPVEVKWGQSPRRFGLVVAGALSALVLAAVAFAWLDMSPGEFASLYVPIVLIAVLAILGARERCELRRSDGTLQLRRWGLPLFGPSVLVIKDDNSLAVRLRALPKTQVEHVSLLHREREGRHYYALGLQKADGTRYEHPLTTDLAFARFIYRIARGDHPARRGSSDRG